VATRILISRTRVRKLMRNLNQECPLHPRSQASHPQAPTVRQIQQHLDSIAKNVVASSRRGMPGHNPIPAGVMLVRRIVQTLRRRHAIDMALPRDIALLLGDEFALRIVPGLEPKAAGAAHTPLQAYPVISVIKPLAGRQYNSGISMRGMRISKLSTSMIVRTPERLTSARMRLALGHTKPSRQQRPSPAHRGCRFPV